MHTCESYAWRKFHIMAKLHVLCDLVASEQRLQRVGFRQLKRDVNGATPPNILSDLPY